MNTQKLIAEWIKGYTHNTPERNILIARRAEPRFVYHNYFARFKIETANLDGSGQSPTDINCFVIEISETDQTAKIASDTSCDTINDL